MTGIVLLHIVPFVYDKFEDLINHYTKKAANIASTPYKNMDNAMFEQDPKSPSGEEEIVGFRRGWGRRMERCRGWHLVLMG
jgi:hypothetical protein